MADITKCEGTNCPMKQTCYRFTAEPNPYRQSYFMTIPLKVDVSVGSQRIFYDCDEYWEYK